MQHVLLIAYFNQFPVQYYIAVESTVYCNWKVKRILVELPAHFRVQDTTEIEKIGST